MSPENHFKLCPIHRYSSSQEKNECTVTLWMIKFASHYGERHSPFKIDAWNLVNNRRRTTDDDIFPLKDFSDQLKQDEW
jgi:hypothetical protein